jgi:hypothetical protein
MFGGNKKTTSELLSKEFYTVAITLLLEAKVVLWDRG